MPWRGPSEPGEYPTLGYSIGEWVEANVVIPDGYRRGQRYLLTDEMWRFLLRFYRVDTEEARLHFYGAQLRRSQKWGKRPIWRGNHPRGGTRPGQVRRLGCGR